MGSFSAHPRFLIIALVLGLVSPCAAREAVTYEEFGAKGDGETDDLPAICEAHKHANAEGLPVKSKAGATYHLGKRALTAVIATDTHWGGSRFIIDDSGEVERHDRPLFEVRSTLKPLALEIGSLRQGQERLETAPAADCLVYVENKRQTIYIRRGLNRNSGTAQKEVFILRKDGTIVGGIDWDYENAIGKGRLLIEDSTLHGRHLVYFRQDYGSAWDGDVIIRNSRWIPPVGGTPVMFGMWNDGTHDFGYPCSMPRRIGIEGLFIGDDGRPESYKEPVFFGDHSRGAEDGRPFPCRLTERIETKGLTTASGKPPQVSESGKMEGAVEWVRK